MARIILARHGSGPANVPKSLAKGERLPGAINGVFADGHAETVLNERLWLLTWHKNWQAPTVHP
jgi:prepilin-type processing-associated H-X9-DG protein